MPAFIMPLDSTAAVTGFRALDSFTQGYVEAMFFTDCTSDNEELEDATFDDLSAEALQHIIHDCQRFQSKHEALLSEAYARDYSEEQAGHDFWLTRNGHGAGFWDRSELAEGALGDKLSAVCRYNDLTLYRGDDDLLYLA